MPPGHVLLVRPTASQVSKGFLTPRCQTHPPSKALFPPPCDATWSEYFSLLDSPFQTLYWPPYLTVSDPAGQGPGIYLLPARFP